MKIFVAYGYNERDIWIKEMVLPIIEAFNSDHLTGNQTYNGTIPQSVLDKIEQSDALIGFTTKRMPQENANGRTHRWVVQELAAALAFRKLTVEVREIDVDPQDGLNLGNQHIDYDETARDKCLIDIVNALGTWHKNEPVKVKLALSGLTDEELLNLGDGGQCEYTVKNGNSESGVKQTKIIGIKGGLFISVPKQAEDSLVKFKINYGNKTWLSYYDSLDSYKIEMRLKQ